MLRRATAIVQLVRIRRRTLLTALLLVSAALGCYVDRVWRQQRAAGAIRQLGGMVAYDYQLSGSDLVSNRGNSWVPASLRQRLGDDYFHSVIYVQVDYRADRIATGRPGPAGDEILVELEDLPALISVELQSGPQSDEGLRQIARLHRLKHLTLCNPGNLTDEGVAHFMALECLESICLNGTDITDESVRLLGELPRLSNLDVRENRLTNQCLKYAGQMQPLRALWVGSCSCCNPAITDEGLIHLARLSALEGLELEGTSVTEGGLERLTDLELKWLRLQKTKVRDYDRVQKAFPECYIGL
jgi:hypothetical protein